MGRRSSAAAVKRLKSRLVLAARLPRENRAKSGPVASTATPDANMTTGSCIGGGGRGVEGGVRCHAVALESLHQLRQYLRSSGLGDKEGRADITADGEDRIGKVSLQAEPETDAALRGRLEPELLAQRLQVGGPPRLSWRAHVHLSIAIAIGLDQLDCVTHRLRTQQRAAQSPSRPILSIARHRTSQADRGC
eukprot:scaffold6857_cov125-Isochrysis_galbana.AAC.2